MKWKASLRKLAGLPTPFSKKEEKSREIWGGEPISLQTSESSALQQLFLIVCNRLM